METVAAFMESRGITMKARPVADNPIMRNDTPADKAWHDTASHWLCTFSRKGSRKRFSLRYSMGSAHTGQPVAGDVLDCVASDVAGFLGADGFDDWAREYGYDTDSRRAERVYRAVKSEVARVEAWLGKDAVDTLAYNVERM